MAKLNILCTVLVVLGLVFAVSAQVNGTTTCGEFGQACCRDGDRAFCNAGAGSCLVRPGDLKGVCTTYGGFFVKDTSKCLIPDFFGNLETASPLNCECSEGFDESCMDISTAAGTNARLCGCVAHLSEDIKDGAQESFGGWYATKAGSCQLTNPLLISNSSCGCPTGYTASAAISIDTPSGLVELHMCQKSGVVGPTWGGFYIRETDAPNGGTATCLTPNQLIPSSDNGGCACSVPPAAISEDNPILKDSCSYEAGLLSNGSKVTLGVCHVVANNPNGAVAISAEALTFAMRLAVNLLLPRLPTPIDGEFNTTQCVTVAGINGCPTLIFSNMVVQNVSIPVLASSIRQDTIVLNATFRNLTVTGHMKILLAGSTSEFDWVVFTDGQVGVVMDAPLNFVGGRLWAGLHMTAVDISLTGQPQLTLSNGRGPLSLLTGTVESALEGFLPTFVDSQEEALKEQGNLILTQVNDLIVSIVPVFTWKLADGRPVLIDFSVTGCKADINGQGIFIPIAAEVFALTPAIIRTSTVPTANDMLRTGANSPHTGAFSLTPAFVDSIAHAARDLIGVDGVVLENAGQLANKTTDLVSEDVEAWVPGISAAYPNTPVQVRVSILEDPVVNFTDTGASMSVQLRAFIDVLPSDSASAPYCDVVDGHKRCNVASFDILADNVFIDVDSQRTPEGTHIAISFREHPAIVVSNVKNNLGEPADASALTDAADGAVSRFVDKSNEFLRQLDTTIPNQIGDLIRIDRLEIVWQAARAMILQLDASAIPRQP